jgi:hypothetical protein
MAGVDAAQLQIERTIAMTPLYPLSVYALRVCGTA